MPDILDFRPDTPITDRERRQRDALVRDERPGAIQAIADAANSELITSFVARQMMGTQFQADPGFELTEDVLKDILRSWPDIPRDYWGEFADARSRQHADYIGANLNSIAESRKRLSSLGYTGVALQVGANIFDPASLALIVGSGGLGAVAKAGKLAAFVRGGLVAAGTETVLTGYRASQDPEVQARDVAVAAGAAFALGGLSGVWARAGLDRAGRNLVKAGELDELRAASRAPNVADVLTPKGRAYWAGQLSPDEATAAVLQELRETVLFDPVTIRVLAGGVDLPPPRVYSANREKLLAGDFRSDNIRVVDDPQLRARIADDGVIEVGGRWVHAGGRERRAMIEQEVVARLAIPELLELGAVEGSEAVFRVQARLGLASFSDAKLIVDKVRTRAFKRVEALYNRQSPLVGAPGELADGFTVVPRGALDEAPAPPPGRPPIAAIGAATPRTISGFPDRPGPLKPGDLDFSRLPDPNIETRSWLGWLRYGMAARLRQSQNPLARRVGRIGVEDVIPDAEGNPVMHAATEYVRRTHNSRTAQYRRALNPAFKQWATARGALTMNPWRRIALFNQFDEEIGLAARLPGAPADPHVAAGVQAFRRVTADGADQMKRYGVPGADAVTAVETYVPRIFASPKVMRLVADPEVGQDGVSSVVRAALVTEHPNLSPAALERLTDHYYRIMHDVAEGTNSTHALRLGADKADDMARVLREQVENITDEEVEAILRASAIRDDASGAPSRLKHRVRLDESASVTLPSGRVVRFTDLLENNASVLAETYSRQAAGNSAMAEFYRAFARTPDDVIQSPEALLNRVKQMASGLGMSPKQIARDEQRIKAVIRAILGRPHDAESSDWAEILRIGRDLNFARLGNQFGVAQIAEIGSIIAGVGLRTAFTTIPELRGIYRRALNGQMSNELLEDIEVILAFGTGRLNHSVTGRFDSVGTAIEVAAGKFERGTRHFRRFVGDTSFMAPITMAMERFAALGAINKWARLAATGKLPSGVRLAAMGLEEADARAIYAGINRHVAWKPGLLGRRVRRIDFDAWAKADPETVSKFIVALDKWGRRVVQQNDPGQLAMWMSHPLGKTLLQFRHFAAVAYEKHLLFNIRMADREGLADILLPMVPVGAIAYIAQTHLNSLGRPDAAEFRKRMLSMEAIAKAAFSRGGASSLLPIAADELLTQLGFESEFSFSRTSGLDRDPLLGNPTFDLFTNARRSTRFIRALFSDEYQISQADFRALRTLLPLQNAYVLKNILDAIGGQFPEDREQ